MIPLDVLLVPAMGVLNRVRGGFLPTGHTQWARGIFAAGAGIATSLATGDPLALLTAPLWELDEFLPNGDYLGARNVWQDAEATGVGIGNVLLPAIALYFMGHHTTAISLVCAGASKGLCYTLAKYIPSQVNGFKQGAEMGELLFGFTIGLGLWI